MIKMVIARDSVVATIRGGLFAVAILFAVPILVNASGDSKFPRPATVVAESAKLLSAPSYQAKVVREAGIGEQFTAVQSVKTFYLVKDEVTSSFLFIDQFALVFAEETSKKESRKNFLRDEVMRLGISHPDYQFFGMYRGSSVKGRRGEIPYDGRAKGKTYPTYYSENATYSPRADGMAILREAQKYLGMRYKLGGNGGGTIDCSALTGNALEKQGIQLPRRASLQAEKGRMVSRDELQVGDLIFFKDHIDPGFLSHVGIYAGGGLFIHASSALGKVGYSSLSEPYYSRHFAFGRRL